MEQSVTFKSAGAALQGTLHLPEGATDPRAAIVSCHGFGGSSRGAGHPQLARALASAGYVVLRFDFRGCGESGGEPGRIICLEEVEDVRNAVTFLQSLPAVDGDRIGVIGTSLGGAVVIHATAVDPRIKVCAATGAVANGRRLCSIQYPDPTNYQAYLARLEDAKRYRETTGRSVMINRYDIVHIPESRRSGMPPGSIMSFPAETAISMLEFSPDELVGHISPRPLLLIHPRDDDVVPKSESEHLASRAGQPCELHILDTSEHFGSGNPELQRIAIDWLGRYLPASSK